MHAIRKVAIIGLGYVGLPTAAIFARAGLDVLGVDINESVIRTINQGRIHISEHDLDVLVYDMVKAGKLRAARTPEPADAFVIAVPTPVNPDNSPDMTLVDSAVASIAPALKRGDIVVIESTSVVGTTERAALKLAQARRDLSFPDTHPEEADVLMAYCPERVLPGATLRELVQNARVLGGIDDRSSQRARELYAHFVQGEMVIASARAAEMSKLTENAFRDVNIAFANELAMICEDLDIDVWSVIRSANLHPRVNILKPGPGVGGHCIPVDPWFIIDQAPNTANLMRMARQTNHARTHRILQKLIRAAGDDKQVPIALLGLAYKPDIDDLRESPSLEILDGLLGEGLGNILAVEPNIAKLPAIYEGKSLRLVDTETALREAQIVVILVGHSQFQAQKDVIRGARNVIDSVGLLG